MMPITACKWYGTRTTSSLCTECCSGPGGAPLAPRVSGTEPGPLEPTKVVRISAPNEYLPTYVGLKTKGIRAASGPDARKPPAESAYGVAQTGDFQVTHRPRAGSEVSAPWTSRFFEDVYADATTAAREST